MLQQKKSFEVSGMISILQNTVFTYQNLQTPSAQSEFKVHICIGELRVPDSAQPLLHPFLPPDFNARIRVHAKIWVCWKHFELGGEGWEVQKMRSMVALNMNFTRKSEFVEPHRRFSKKTLYCFFETVCIRRRFRLLF